MSTAAAQSALAAQAARSGQTQDVQLARDALHPLCVTCIVFIILNTLFVVLRFVSRNFVKRLEVGWDDILIIPSWLCNIGTCILGLRESSITLLNVLKYTYLILHSCSHRPL